VNQASVSPAQVKAANRSRAGSVGLANRQRNSRHPGSCGLVNTGRIGLNALTAHQTL